MMNQRGRPSRTGITGSRKVTASDLRSSAENTQCEPLLPRSPRAVIGLIAHEMLELAVTGRFGGLKLLEVEAVWLSKVRGAESQMNENWRELSLTPLANSIRDLEVLKIRLLNQILPFTQSTWASERTGEHGKTSTEVWIETPDHAIGGFVDSISSTQEKTTLRDFKNGLIIDTSGSPETIKPEYRTQLELYCGVYFESTGRWPTEVEIVPSVGDPISIGVDPDRCRSLVAQAKQSLAAINEQIANSTAETTPSSLANPSHHCMRCEFRPTCSSYKASAVPASLEDGPADLFGEVTEVASFSNGTSAISVRTPFGVKRARGLEFSSQRHPAMALLSKGRYVGIYGLKAIRERREFTQGLLTTIYLEKQG
jgi:PD-(D/E)XK nuclease superfamily